MTVFPLLLAVIVFLATREMFGTAPAFIALALMAFEPNILAHGPLVTNDMALACCLFAAVYAFWRYVVNPNAWRLAVVRDCGRLDPGGQALRPDPLSDFVSDGAGGIADPVARPPGSDSREDHPDGMADKPIHRVLAMTSPGRMPVPLYRQPPPARPAPAPRAHRRDGHFRHCTLELLRFPV